MTRRVVHSVTVLLLVFLCVGLASPALYAKAPPHPASSSADLVATMQKNIGGSAPLSAGVGRIRFTWKIPSKGVTRTHDWDVSQGVVHVTLKPGDAVIEVPVQGGEGLTPRQLEAHKAFVNDHYWLLFEHLFPRDPNVTLLTQSLPDPNAPPATDAILEVRYGGATGYTPADAYRLFLDAKAQPVGWAYFRAGQTQKPSLVTTRERYIQAAGLRVPTLFKGADGQVFIEIEDVVVTPVASR